METLHTIMIDRVKRTWIEESKQRITQRDSFSWWTQTTWNRTHATISKNLLARIFYVRVIVLLKRIENDCESCPLSRPHILKQFSGLWFSTTSQTEIFCWFLSKTQWSFPLVRRMTRQHPQNLNELNQLDCEILKIFTEKIYKQVDEVDHFYSVILATSTNLYFDLSSYPHLRL